MPAVIFQGNNVKTLKNNLDMNGLSFTASDNQAVAADVTGFVFANSLYRSFEAEVSIIRNTSYASYKISGIQKAADWEVSQQFVGDDTGIHFDITAAGQITYTSTNTGFTATLKFSSIVVGA